jgi:tetratricopeptide (TPR) repeat protein
MNRLLLFLLLPALAGQGDEVEVSSSLNRNTAQVGETVLLTVTLRAPGRRSPEIENPSIEGLEVLSTSDRASFRFSPSLGAIREISREYVLRVLQPGEIIVPPIRVEVDGVWYETESLQLMAEDRGTADDLPNRLGPRPEEEVAVRLWVEPETAYVGQQVTLTVGAFFDPLVRSRLQRQPEYRPPEVQGFWTADLPGTPRPERRVVGGREYYVQIYRRALFPLSPGSLRIDPAAVIYEVRRGLIYAPETFQVESAPATIVVRQLPQVGVPVDFAGAVGRYETQIWFDRSDLRAGEAVNLHLEVRGTGNLSSIARPVLPEIPGLRVYDGSEDAEVQLRGVEFAGHKRFSWVLVPERGGQYVLPELRLPFFDPIEAAYRVAGTDPVTLLVESAPTASMDSGAGGAAVRFVKARPARQPAGLASGRPFWVVQALPLLILLGSLAFGRYRVRAPAFVRKRPQRRQQAFRHLRPLAESGDAAFFGELRVAVLAWLENRLHRPGLQTLGVVQVQHALEDAGVPPNVALEVIELLESCSRLRYSPEPPGKSVAHDTLAQADRLLALVDREAVAEKRLRATTGKGLYLIPFALVAFGPAPASSQESAELSRAAERWFLEGVDAYARGDYVMAVERFGSALTVRPRDANLLYNIGNAYYELDERGFAVAYWIRALRIRPRDDDAKFNLRLAVGEDPVVGSTLNPLPLSRDEMAVLFTVFWFGGCAALVARRRWRKGYLTFVGGASITLALFCAILIMYPRSDYAIISSPEAALRRGPVRQSEILASAAPGTAFRVQERRGDWLRVSRGGDREGWIPAEEVELLD